MKTYTNKNANFTAKLDLSLIHIYVGYKNIDLSMNFNGAAGVGYAFTKEAFGEFSGSAGRCV